MCDTLVSLTDHGVLFAKNSDRDPNEAQRLEWHDAARHPAGSTVHTTWTSIAQVERTNAVLLARPWWMWGAEMGANEHGVVIGNEAVFTNEPMSTGPGLLGMDLLRLALERAGSAPEAADVIVTLLERHGQSGPCSAEHPKFTYHNSFLIADPNGAIVVETAGRRWASETVAGAGRSISNGLTIGGFAEAHADRLRGRVAQCAIRRSVTQRHAERARGVTDLMAALRDNGTMRAPHWSPINGSMRGPNMHAGGLVTASQTVNSWVSDLTGDAVHWSTGTADPAMSLFIPLRVEEPADPGPRLRNRFDPAARWWRHALLHRRALRDWSAAHRLLADDRDRLERGWLTDPPATPDAREDADRAIEDWTRSIVEADLAETRPWWLRRRWDRWNRESGLPELDASKAA